MHGFRVSEDVIFTCNGGFRVVHAKITCDGIKIKVIEDVFGNITEQTFFDKLLCKVTHTIHLIYINVVSGIDRQGGVSDLWQQSGVQRGS